LEIGFGPGIAVAEVARRAARGRVYGVDHSAVMVRQARRRNAAAVRAGRVHLVRASVDDLPAFDGEPLDVIVAVNTVGFWPRPDDQLARLRGLLRPGGRIALASQPRCPGATADTTVRAGEELQDLVRRAGPTADVHTVIFDGFRRRGVGRALLAAAERIALDHGAVRLRAVIFAPNEAAVGFCAAAGFGPHGILLAKDLDRQHDRDRHDLVANRPQRVDEPVDNSALPGGNATDSVDKQRISVLPLAATCVAAVQISHATRDGHRIRRNPPRETGEAT
jgi:SAM-dependent methyltransferase